jgi:thymidine kinase
LIVVMWRHATFFFLSTEKNMSTLPPSLNLVIGCMFSGKSSHLMAEVKRFRAVGLKCAVINHVFDTRCKHNAIKTHNDVEAPARKYKTLQEFTDWEEFDVIAIDEGQFFDDIVEHTARYVNKGKKYVLVAGLSGDSSAEPFENMSKLISRAQNIVFNKALCVHCRKEATFSKRTVRSSGSTKIFIGGEESYEPVCFVHFTKD